MVKDQSDREKSCAWILLGKIKNHFFHYFPFNATSMSSSRKQPCPPLFPSEFLHSEYFWIQHCKRNSQWWSMLSTLVNFNNRNHFIKLQLYIHFITKNSTSFLSKHNITNLNSFITTLLDIKANPWLAQNLLILPSR